MRISKFILRSIFLIIFIGTPKTSLAQGELFPTVLEPQPIGESFMECFLFFQSTPPKQKSEVSIGIGGFPLYIDDTAEEDKISAYTPLDVYRNRKIIYDGRHVFPAFDMSYYRHIVTYNSLNLYVGGSMAEGYSKERMHEVGTNRLSRTYSKRHLDALLGIKIGLHTEYVGFYCGAVGGPELVLHNDFYGKKDVKVTGAVHVTILGMSVGKRVFCYGELGVGCLGVLRGGLGYRF